MNQTQARRRYLKEFGAAIALYVALVALSVYAATLLEPGAPHRPAGQSGAGDPAGHPRGGAPGPPGG
ncbi:hypothetical protein WJ973_18715 [Achromobacter xylosoxidans]